MTDMIHFEDLTPGTTFELGPKPVSSDEIIEFASEFDPQPMHLDEKAGEASILGGLAASGWHTCAMMMRMIYDAYVCRAAGEGAPGIEFVSWKRPVLAGDVLTGTSEVLEARRSASRPAIGIVRFRTKLTNQRGETVYESENPIMIRVRTPEAKA
ncbi:MAG: enoyl-CoA hydratase [Rhizobiales bacterium]|nr:enoyl-CoA hydratase [Hyphomicrobiales bacterium]MBA68840.1 enoyl-CoA hydratase [Hyphomicrobiales bacterium]|tara:strand:+ start:1727 stop:2191 length:465 start_codon:yes stop_codon:yes gene_type:complete